MYIDCKVGHRIIPHGGNVSNVADGKQSFGVLYYDQRELDWRTSSIVSSIIHTLSVIVLGIDYRDVYRLVDVGVMLYRLRPLQNCIGLIWGKLRQRLHYFLLPPVDLLIV